MQSPKPLFGKPPVFLKRSPGRFRVQRKFMSKVPDLIFRFPCVRLGRLIRGVSLGWRKIRPYLFTIPLVPTQTPMWRLTCCVACPMCVISGLQSVMTRRSCPAQHQIMALNVLQIRRWQHCGLNIFASHAVPRRVTMSRRCITPNAVLSRLRWSMLPSVKTSVWMSCDRTLPMKSCCGSIRVRASVPIFPMR